MEKCWESHWELQIEVNLGTMKNQGNYYKVALVRVQEMATLRMVVKSWRNQHFDIHWEQRVDPR